ncbi:MAG: WYL domain-containing protein, partial [Oscillospiraceae bacterium]|nr:WYL domain-containing protein [Oscillospiraceae bacterium]
RMDSVELLGPWNEDEYVLPHEREETLVMELYDARNALERVMLHFSDLEKETERIGDRRYRITLKYRQGDETEILIRILSFGPVLKVTEPENMVSQIRERLSRQAALTPN